MELLISKKGKKARFNHIEQRKLSHYIGNMNVVMFAPEDLHLVKGSPQIRRRFIDMEIGQVSPVYLHEYESISKGFAATEPLFETTTNEKANRSYLS